MGIRGDEITSRLAATLFLGLLLLLFPLPSPQAEAQTSQWAGTISASQTFNSPQPGYCCDGEYFETTAQTSGQFAFTISADGTITGSATLQGTVTYSLGLPGPGQYVYTCSPLTFSKIITVMLGGSAEGSTASIEVPSGESGFQPRDRASYSCTSSPPGREGPGQVDVGYAIFKSVFEDPSPLGYGGNATYFGFKIPLRQGASETLQFAGPPSPPSMGPYSLVSGRVDIALTSGSLASSATTSSSSSTSTPTSTTASVSTSTGAEGIPEFSYQLLGVTLFTLVVVLSYLAVRHRT